MSSKLVLTASAAVFGIFGAGWLIVPGMFYKFWAIVPDTNQYMGRRYGAFMLGLMVISWLSRSAPNTQARSVQVTRLVGSSVRERVDFSAACEGAGAARWSPP